MSNPEIISFYVNKIIEWKKELLSQRCRDAKFYSTRMTRITKIFTDFFIIIRVIRVIRVLFFCVSASLRLNLHENTFTSYTNCCSDPN